MIGGLSVHRSIIPLSAFALFVGAGGTSLAQTSTQQTVTVSVPLNLTNIPISQVGASMAACYAYPPSVPLSALTTFYQGNASPIAVAQSQVVKFTSSTYSGALITAITIADTNLNASVTQGLPYQCLVGFYPPGQISVGESPLDPRKFFVTQAPNIVVSGMIPLQSGPPFIIRH
jgi:hypothetical protein